MKHCKVKLKSGLIGHVLHVDELEPNKEYIVRVKGSAYHSMGLVKGSQLEVI